VRYASCQRFEQVKVLSAMAMTYPIFNYLNNLAAAALNMQKTGVVLKEPIWFV
jgi:hypothetical protein